MSGDDIFSVALRGHTSVTPKRVTQYIETHGVQMEDIVRPVRFDDEAMMAFREILYGLFEAHPLPPEAPRVIQMWRNNAIEINEPLRACYYACDCGAPNDEILAAYALLFL